MRNEIVPPTDLSFLSANSFSLVQILIGTATDFHLLGSIYRPSVNIKGEEDTGETKENKTMEPTWEIKPGTIRFNVWVIASRKPQSVTPVIISVTRYK